LGTLLQCMQRFGVPESLIGDLVERQRTHSALWFCRQSVVAVLVTGGREIVEHKWFAMRTLVAGWIVGYLLIAIVARALHAVQWTTDLGYALLIRPTGWYHLPELIIECVVMLLLGTVVMRVTLQHRAAALLLWMTAPLPFATLAVLNYIHMLNAGLGGGWRGFPSEPFIQSFRFVMLIQVLAFSIAAPMCVLLGGLWSGARSRELVIDGIVGD